MKNIIQWKADRKMLIKEELEASLDCGMPPDKRPIEQHIRFGLINLDKPRNPSSHEVTSWVKKLLKVKHAGHGGTLEAQIAGKIPWCPVSYPLL